MGDEMKRFAHEVLHTRVRAQKEYRDKFKKACEVYKNNNKSWSIIVELNLKSKDYNEWLDGFAAWLDSYRLGPEDVANDAHFLYFIGNDKLQVVIAELSLEQSRLAAHDSRISIKNGQRSLVLAILAAIYLPLSLAASIFGMNIKDVDSKSVRF
ncbi:Putative Mg2+ transporter protein, CorA-like/Zinc transport protein ZntB [Septoria linicola]|uniref:Mg2+ transporter protein, CorA-like/Zinc transport protein ZntB n=1 Tax=Septoria linicola TaxID=215465 RepID=A0A9Q9EE88_9PEZI|nr:Putative Mg2+ transporter protein, CorA-like/Zinc transport protein ZntB [Septoria linicola]